MKTTRIRFLVRSAMIAALYVALTLVSAMLGLSSGAIQVRLSEALCILPVYTTAAIPGITVGCFLANLLTGGTIWDLTLGVLATFLGLFFAHLLRRSRYLAPLPTILSNGFLIPYVLILAGFIPHTAASYGMTALTVGLGELIACGGLGTVLLRYLDKHPATATKLFGK